MIKEIIDKLVALLAVSALLASCSESELWQNPQTEARDGYICLLYTSGFLLQLGIRLHRNLS